MHDNTPDPLNDLLGPPALPDPARLEAARQDTFARTLRLLRRRRARRRLGRAAALAACYAAGLLTAWGLTIDPGEQPPPAPSPLASADRPDTRGEAPAEERRTQAEKAERSELYRGAGDRFLAEDDPARAVHCYTQALNTGTEDERSISPDDSWLLMAIKHARQKEMDDAQAVD